MIWILAIRGASTRLQSSPFTETSIAGVHSVVYKPGIEPVPASGNDASSNPAGTFTRGLHRMAGIVFSYDGSAAETLFTMNEVIDLVIRYRASGQGRKRTLRSVLFVGNATVTVPSQNRGASELIGVPFRVQIPQGETIADHILDEADP